MNASFEMEKEFFAAAFEAACEPTAEELKDRFKSAFDRTRDIHSAMACVNEVVVEPLTYEGLMARIGEAG